MHETETDPIYIYTCVHICEHTYIFTQAYILTHFTYIGICTYNEKNLHTFLCIIASALFIAFIVTYTSSQALSNVPHLK